MSRAVATFCVALLSVPLLVGTAFAFPNQNDRAAQNEKEQSYRQSPNSAQSYEQDQQQPKQKQLGGRPAVIVAPF